MDTDVAIIGGSFAGLSAALQIARGRRNVVVIDDGKPRNRFAPHSHGFLTRDGVAPDDILEEARRQLALYPTASLLQGRAERVTGTADDFTVTLDSGPAVSAKRLILTSGVRDTLPPIPGLEAEWGRRVAHCPYCHGYEFNGGPIAVIASSQVAVDKAMLVRDWGPVTLFVNGALEPDPQQLEGLRQRDVSVVRSPVTNLESQDDGVSIVLSDGSRHLVSGIFIHPKARPASDIAEEIGCAMGDGAFGPIVVTDERKRTSVPGVFAAGDMARPAGNVALAVADGAIAGASAHQSLIFGTDSR